MAELSGFEKLRKKRIGYVESARENDFEEGLKSLLSDLYPDNAHFIYELLQNAEDALATTVEFSLNYDHLTVSHDGKRPFSLRDIESITGIGRSTKKDDPTQIGKFGVGFKAVFAYTTRPEVLSGEHSFAIVDLFIPEGISGKAGQGSTIFTFPFDRTDKPAAIACEEVERGLLELDEKTLLFLNNISTITYELPDGTIGIIERIVLDERVIRIRKTEGDDFLESRWLRIVGPASVNNEGEAPLRVAAAFRLEREDSPKFRVGTASDAEGTGADHKWAVSPLKNGDVSIYFPAIKESSGLRFHIHAPFASTVARDSVRDDPGNLRLVMDIAALVVNELPRLRDEGLIDDRFLASLPNEEDSISHPYTLIREAVTEAFNDRPITPVRGSGNDFAAARSLVSSPSEFRNSLEPNDLDVLFKLAHLETHQPPRWIRDRDGRAGKFLAGLDTIEFSWKQLNSSLINVRDTGYNDRDLQLSWLVWLDAKSDKMLTNFYLLIGRGRSPRLLLTAELKSIPLIRLQQKGKVKHVKGPETFLPSDRNDIVQARVSPDLSYFDEDEDRPRAHNLEVFYSAAGVRRWNKLERIQLRLASYTKGEYPASDIDLERNFRDIRAFVRHGLANRNTAREIFANVPFLLALQSDGNYLWSTPRQTFLDAPYCNTGLSSLYPAEKLYYNSGKGAYAHDREPYPLGGFYVEVEHIEEFLQLVGTKVGVEVIRAEVVDNPQFIDAWRSGRRESGHGKNVDWTIKRLDDIVSIGNRELIHTLWRTVVAAPTSTASAMYKPNASHVGKSMESQLAQRLKTLAWIPDRDGGLSPPSLLTLDELPDDWERPADNSLAHKLGFGADAVKRRQKQEAVHTALRDKGLDSETAGLLIQVIESMSNDHLRQVLVRAQAVSNFPEDASDAPERRAAMAATDAVSAPLHSTVIREQSVVVGQAQASSETKAYLRAQYTSTRDEMHCQSCRQPLPFKTRDGLWYFEAVRLIGARKQVHKANALALCPLCAALFKYARHTTDESLVEQLASTIIKEGQGLVWIPVMLNDKRVEIGFTGKHAIDIKSALRVAGGQRVPNSWTAL